jgi:hypothetical protein
MNVELYKRFSKSKKLPHLIAEKGVVCLDATELLKTILRKCDEAKTTGRKTTIIFYDSKKVFHQLVMMLAAHERVSIPLIYTDCHKLESNTRPPHVAPAFVFKSDAFFVFDNFQSVSTQLDRKLDFVHWGDGERNIPQISVGSFMLFGFHRKLGAKETFRNNLSDSVITRCSHYVLHSTEKIRELRKENKLRGS